MEIRPPQLCRQLLDGIHRGNLCGRIPEALEWFWITMRFKGEVNSIRSMVDAMKWAIRRVPPAVFLNAVAQDEFTHDVIVRVGDDYFVVFDTT